MDIRRRVDRRRSLEANSDYFEDRFKGVPKILLVDDDHVFTSVFKEVARCSGVAVQVANDYQDVVLDENRKFNTVILDFDLGQTNGKVVSKKIFANYGPLPIVLISAKERSVVNEVDVPEIFDFVHKSVGKETVLSSAVDAFQRWYLYK